MATATKPKTPPSTRRLDSSTHDPDTTPTRRRPEIDSFPAFSRRKSWEEDSVTSLADPRDLSHLDLWEDQFIESPHPALKEFLYHFVDEFSTRPRECMRMHRVLLLRNDNGQVDFDAIIEEASLLFAGYPDLAQSLNHFLPPGYTLEAADVYVTVTTPLAVWRRYPDGQRVYLMNITTPSSN